MVDSDIKNILSIADCLRTEEQVEAAIDSIADAISVKLSESAPLVLCVMNGGLIITGKLLPRLQFPLETDYLHATRYGHQLSGDSVRWLARPTTTLQGRTVLIVDDILDEGFTLAAIRDFCLSEGAREVYTAVLVDKIHDRPRADISADFIGMRVEDRFLFGCGMDYKGFWRNLPALYAIR